MFIKVPFLIFVLGSVPFVALAQEGKEKVWLQLFPDISCNLTISVLSPGLHSYSDQFLKLAFKFCNWASTTAVIWKETQQEFSMG